MIEETLWHAGAGLEPRILVGKNCDCDKTLIMQLMCLHWSKEFLGMLSLSLFSVIIEQRGLRGYLRMMQTELAGGESTDRQDGEEERRYKRLGKANCFKQGKKKKTDPKQTNTTALEKDGFEEGAEGD